jgi:myo-inositol 2-dehydrogenase / D-chiro-inositol 1-dehydrogenase
VPDLRIGLVGVGWVGATHRTTLAETDGAELVATADVVPGRGDYEDWREMIAKEHLDAVVICTPPMHHRDPVIAAAEAGLAIYLEKPVAGTLDDAHAMSVAIARRGCICAVGYQYRALTLPSGLRLRALVGRGLSDTADRSWFGDQAQGGSQILERASHLIDLQRALAGEVMQVSGHEMAGLVSLTLEFASGAVGSIVVGRVPNGPGWSLDVVSEDGTVALDLDPKPPPIRTSLQRFLEAVRRRDGSLVCCSLSEGVATLKVALACERAVRLGGSVALKDWK